MEDELVLLSEAARELDLSPERLRQLIRENRAKAGRMGRFYVLRRSEIERLRTGEYRKPPGPKPGRPPKRRPAGHQ